MARVKIVVDSASDLREGDGEFSILPLGVLLGEREGLDGVDISPDDIYNYYKASKKTPKTAAISPKRFSELFAKLTADGSEVLYLAISSDMSACYNNARLASNEFEGVYAYDSKLLSTGVGILAFYADELAKKGLGAQEIIKRLDEKREKLSVSLIVDTMTFLHKGGRCGSLTALIAGVLKIKPSIVMKNGKLTVGKKYIGSAERALVKYTNDVLKNAEKIDPKRVYVVHTSPKREILDEVKRRILTAIPNANVIERIAGATITSHTGKGAMAIIYCEL
ncbi:MAG: DegV family protein [Clostridia bacterium]|nr:DegV family protein [Clostridia bacterium]